MHLSQVGSVALFGLLLVAGIALPATGMDAGVAGDSDPGSVGEGVPVTVTEVTDGDTVDVKYDDGSTATVRFLGVDTPEVYADNTPGEFEGIPNSEISCLNDAGEAASQYATTHLLGEQVQLRFDEESQNRGGSGRVLGYLYVDGENFNHDLVETGHARVYDAPFSLSESFYKSETEAQQAGQNLWNCRPDSGSDDSEPGQPDQPEQPDQPDQPDCGESPPETQPAVDALTIDWINADADSLYHERVKLTNTGDETIDLSGYRLENEAGAGMTFADGFSLGAGDSVYVHTGSGDGDSDDRYVGRSSELWDDTHGTATVYGHSRTIVAEHSY